MKLIDNKIMIKDIAGFIIILLHFVGMIGLSNDFSRTFFLSLVPFNLLLTFALCFLFISDRINFKPIVIIFLLGFFIEVFGVKTGLLFGEYNYGNFLGIQFLEVPLLIGVNWLILVFCTYGFVSKFTDNSILKVSISSVLMVLIDILIEPVAVKLGFWSWSSLYIPIQNYFMWLITSLLMHFILFKFHVRISFKLSLYLMISQLMFFIFLLFVL